MKPYYDHGGITIYHGDCREILPSLSVKVCITDPVWPNAHPDLVGHENPLALFRDAVNLMPRVERLCVWLGCQSDPRFLQAVPSRLEFLRMCYLRKAVPSYNGRCLVTGDVLYCFGTWPESKEGARVLPGEKSVTSKPKLRQDHPCSRNYEHALWVLRWWISPGEVVVDPFMGVGTSARAAKDLGLEFIGIEVEEKYCETTVKRLAQEVLFGT